MIEGIRTTCFLLGCQRSGTTLLGHVLGAPRDAVLIDEVDGLYDWFRDPRAGADTVLDRMKAKYACPDDRFVSAQGGRTGLAPGVRTLILKAPNLTYDIDRIAAPGLPAVLVFPVRDPRSVVASMLNLKRVDFVGNQLRLLAASPLAADFADEIGFLADDRRPPYERMAMVWRIKTGLHRQALRAGLPTHVVRYEDLVADPETQVRALCAHAGLRFDPCMLDHSRVYTGHAQGRFDRTRKIDTASVEGWRDQLSPRQRETIVDVAGPEARALGYV